MESTDCLRESLRSQWLAHIFGDRAYQVSLVAGDASFRKYFRVTHEQGDWILMDAPPPQEDVRPFLAVGETLRQAGARVPRIYHQDVQQGFLLLEDFGPVQFADDLTAATAPARYPQALRQLAEAQGRFSALGLSLPVYCEAKLLQEMHLVRDWYFPQELMQTLSEDLSQALADLEEALVVSALSQPQTLVHRDYHSRNLMCLPSGELGWIDFQDALLGPVTYDAVSLLKDAYVTWPRSQQLNWLEGYFAGLPPHLQGGDFAQFVRWFDAMGVQRHLKVVGIFARLAHRDGKRAYLDDIPRVLAYLAEMAQLYPEFSALKAVLAQIPAEKFHP